MKTLEVKGLVSGYGKGEILQGIDIYLDANETVAIIGPNGAGKSTLLKTIFGIIPPKSGKVFFEEEDITGWPIERIFEKGISIVPQEENIFPSLTVLENLEMGGFLIQKDIGKKLEEIYNIFPILKDRSSQKAGTLSGGERQMLAISRALMTEPRLLLVDEPSSGLAPLMVKELFSKIREISEQGTAVLIVEQNEEALKLASRCYLLDSGRIKYHEKAEYFIDNPDITKMYLGGE